MKLLLEILPILLVIQPILALNESAVEVALGQFVEHRRQEVDFISASPTRRNSNQNTHASFNKPNQDALKVNITFNLLKNRQKVLKMTNSTFFALWRITFGYGSLVKTNLNLRGTGCAGKI